MALSFAESASLMVDPQFRGRIKVACLAYASRILAGQGATPPLPSWSIQAYNSPDQIAQNVQPATVMEPGVQSIGGTIDDGGLAFSVENAVQKMVNL